MQVLDTLAEIQERHEAVKELERSLLDLHQIFLDMAVLVEAQGEMLDNIEAQVSLIPLTISWSVRPSIRVGLQLFLMERFGWCEGGRGYGIFVGVLLPEVGHKKGGEAVKEF